MIYKFHLLGISMRCRGFKFGGTNATNEYIAEITNESNERIARETNATNAENTRLTNENNYRMNEANNQLQMQLQQEENDFNLRMWNLNNAYNSPEQQLQRAKQAGINPNMAIGEPVSSQPVQQTSLPQTSPSRDVAPVANPWTAQGYTATPEGSLAGTLSRTIGDLQRSIETQKTFADSELSQIQGQFLPQMLAGNVKGINLDNAVKAGTVKNIEADTRLKAMQVKGMEENVNLVRANTAEAWQRVANWSEDTMSKYLDNQYKIKTFDDRVNSIKIKNNLDEKTAWAIQKRVEIEQYLAPARAGQMWAQARYSNSLSDFQEECNKRGIARETVNSINASLELYYSQATGQDLQNDITRKFGFAIAEQQLDKLEYENSTPVRIFNAVGQAIGDVAVGVGMYYGAKGIKASAAETTPINKNTLQFQTDFSQ